MKDDDDLLEEEVEQQPSAEQAQRKAEEGMHRLAESHGPAAGLPSRPILGVQEDLSGAALVRRAIEEGQGPGDDWVEFKYRHRQAEQDSQLLYATLQQAEQFHQVRGASGLVFMHQVTAFVAEAHVLYTTLQQAEQFRQVRGHRRASPASPDCRLSQRLIVHRRMLLLPLLNFTR